jgi:membrane associated rhomboid family serine protease
MSLAQILLENMVKGGMMKKMFVYLLIILMFGSLFGVALSRNHTLKDDAPVVGAVLGVFVMPVAAYAQDTSNTGTEPPPSVPRDP